MTRISWLRRKERAKAHSSAAARCDYNHYKSGKERGGVWERKKGGLGKKEGGSGKERGGVWERKRGDLGK